MNQIQSHFMRPDPSTPSFSALPHYSCDAAHHTDTTYAGRLPAFNRGSAITGSWEVVVKWAQAIDTGVLSNPICAIQICLTAVPAWLGCNLMLFKSLQHAPSGLSWWAAHGSQHFWASCCAVLVLVGAAGIVAKNRWARLLSATGLAVGHASIACGFYLGKPTSFGVGIYTIWAVLAVWRVWLQRRQR